MSETVQSQSAPRWTEFALLGCLAMLWGTSYLLVRIAVNDIPPVTLIAIRVSVAAAILMAVVFAQRVSLPRDARTWGLLFIQSLLNSTAAWTLLAWGQQFIDSGMASVLNSTSPIFVFLITFFITRHEATGFVRLAGAIIGICGVILIVGPDVLKGLGQQVAGQIAALTSAAMYGFAAIFGKRFGHLPATVTAAGTMLCASACLVPASLLIDRPWTLAPPATALLAAVLLGVFCTGLALLLYFRLIRTLGSMGVASQSYLRACVGVTLGVVILGEQITPFVAMGLAAALTGVALINIPIAKRASVVK